MNADKHVDDAKSGSSLRGTGEEALQLPKDLDDIDAFLDEMVTEFVERFRSSERPSVNEYAQRYPAVADQIRELLPTIVEMEGLRSVSRVDSSADTIALGSVGRMFLREFDDYEIIREVGRGGMGVVYEARQKSLDRSVALKVLPLLSLLKPELVERFHREARIAGQLDHPNIVPVFGVGEVHGFHYYVMQFIDGIGLDEFITRRPKPKAQQEETSIVRDWAASEKLSSGVTSEGEISSPGKTPRAKQTISESEWLIAIQEVKQQAKQKIVEVTEQNRRSQSQDSTSSDKTSSVRDTLPEDAELPYPAPSLPPGPQGGRNSTARVQDTFDEATFVAPEVETIQPDEPDERSALRPSIDQILSIGIQAANALQHAHEQGTLHRDIKPGNLLLDRAGVVWVADFGLAKAIADENITDSGNVVGTIRYMAPEHLRGSPEARSDIYSLGITLYELTTGRRAWQGIDRKGLMQQVLHGDLVPPSKISEGIPRDLETVILKATAREARHRYENAGQLAVDLQCIADERPISARPIGIFEQAYRWIRRARINAGMAGVSLLCVILAATTAVLFLQSTTSDIQTSNDSSLALQMLERSFVKFSNDWDSVSVTRSPPGIDSMQAIRLLEELPASYDALADTSREDVSLAFRRIHSRRVIADMRQRMGLHDDAIAMYAEAVTVCADLAQIDVQKKRTTILRAILLSRMGTSFKYLGKNAEATEAFEKAIETLTDIPASRESRLELARIHFLMAHRLAPGEKHPNFEDWDAMQLTANDIGHLDKALEILGDGQSFEYLKAITRLERNRTEFSDPRSQQQFVNTLLNLQVGYSPEIRHAHIEAFSRIRAEFKFSTGQELFLSVHEVSQALAMIRRLHDDYPTNVQFSTTLIRIHRRLATLLSYTDQSPELLDLGELREYRASAERNLRIAARLQRTLMRRFPNSVGYFHWFADTQLRLGPILVEQQRFQESLFVYTRAVDAADVYEEHTVEINTVLARLYDAQVETFILEEDKPGEENARSQAIKHRESARAASD